jgi:hypothetical protein
MTEFNHTPYSLYKISAGELSKYQNRFLKEFGFFPYLLDGVFHSSLDASQQKLCYAFWNQKEIYTIQTLMELFYDICDEIEARKS